MKAHKRATRSVTLAGVLGACLLIPAPAPAARHRAITGTLDRAGLTVLALAPDGSVSRARAKPRFRLVPRAPTVTLHLRDRTRTYLGPVVVAGSRGEVTVGVRAGATLGRIDVHNGYARVRNRPARRAIDRRLTARLPTAPRPVPPAPVGGGSEESDSDRADAALIVAIAAAALAAASLAWQLLAVRRRRRRRVEVEVRLGLPIYPQGGGDWSVFVEVRNGTDHPVRWVASTLELGDGRRLFLMHQPSGGELPAVLQPHDSHQTWAPCRILEQGGLELTEPVVGTVKLDSGEIVRSARRRLVSRSARKRLR
jgi:hypothetical protein